MREIVVFSGSAHRPLASAICDALGVPLVTGCVLLAPVIKFLELRSGFDLNHRSLRVAIEHQDAVRMLIPRGLPIAEPFHESFLTFLPTFFTQLDRFTWSHLWFVAYLLALTIVWLPLFVSLRRGSGRIRSRPAWSVYVPLVPLVSRTKACSSAPPLAVKPVMLITGAT